VTASDDKIARVWNAVNGKELLTLAGHEGPVATAVFSPDGNILTASEDGTARLWWTWHTVEGLVEEAKRRMPRELTDEQKERFGLQLDRLPIHPGRTFVGFDRIVGFVRYDFSS
jgi:WD40 repeat protein